MTTVAGIRFIDTIGQNLGRLIALPYWQDRLIASYTTRSFAASDSQFADIHHPIKIDQANTTGLFRGATVKDVESGAAEIGRCVELERAGFHFVTYLSESNLAGARRVLKRGQYWVADWSLSESEALNFIARNPDVVGVQFASPTSNPNSVVPGANGATIRQLNVDLSVGRKDFWLPNHPTPPPETTAHGIWEAKLEHNMQTGAWRITPLPGQNVKRGTKMLTDNFAGGVDQHSGVWHVKGTPR